MWSTTRGTLSRLKNNQRKSSAKVLPGRGEVKRLGKTLRLERQEEPLLRLHKIRILAGDFLGLEMGVHSDLGVRLGVRLRQAQGLIQ